jgi:hypothetical protein
MAVSRLLPAGGANDFNLNLGGAYTSVIFDKEYASGSYSVTSGNNDSTMDLYAYNSDGSLAGYTSTKSFTATKGFNKMVILGGQVGDVLGFAYKTTYTTSNDSDEVTAGPVVESISPTSAPNVDSTFTVTGRNFASDCSVTFTSANTSYSPTLAKNIVRSSVTSLIVTRPDNLTTAFSPYSITVQNPGVANPTGSNSHILPNSLTAGASPVWVTGTTLPAFTKDVSYSTTVQATDADAGSAITYSIASGSLPSGITLTSTSGVVSGTTTSSTNASVTIRATDAGGNFVDRAFTLPNAGPVFVTTNASLARPISGVAYSATISATDDSGATPTYTLTSGTLPTGLSFSAGTISGTTTDTTNRTLIFTATDANGSTGTLTVTNFRALVAVLTTITSSQTYTPTTNNIPNLLLVGGGGGGGSTNNYGSGGGSGGGAGGFVNRLTNVSVVPGQTYNLVVGAGAANANLGEGNGSRALDGGTTTAFGERALGGSGGMNCGNGGDAPSAPNRGPGGGAASYGFGASSPYGGPFDQGGQGRNCPNNFEGGGGGSAISSGGTGINGEAGATWSPNGTVYGGGGAAGSGQGNTGSGGAGGGATGRNGSGQGFDAGFYGGGGGGIIANQSTNTRGGRGFNGVIIIQEFV